jgi:hypothetical protein
MWIFLSSAPLSLTKPVPSVSRSAASTSSSSAATSSMISRASAAAMMTALPTRCVPRLANVPMQCGPLSVSAVSTRTFSGGRPSVSAAHWVTTVLRPCPRSTEDSETTKVPVVVAWTSAWEGSPPEFMPVG